jgi:hypothetical protein
MNPLQVKFLFLLWQGIEKHLLNVKLVVLLFSCNYKTGTTLIDY